MKRTNALITVALLLTACSSPEEIEPIRPVRVYTVTPPSELRKRNFSGIAKASEEAVLSFRVPGPIVSIAVQVGDEVKKGQVLATIDPLDYRLELERASAKLREAEANERNAAANYERVRALYELDVASRTDIDNARAESESTYAQVVAAEKQRSLAERQLSYTQLLAPSNGAIAEKIAEVNENVDAGTPVLKMVSGTRPEVDIQMPENLIGIVKPGAPVHVYFSALDQTLRGQVLYKGVATTAASTTFPVTLGIDDPNHEVRSGMSADVAFTMPYDPTKPIVTVPAVAVQEDLDGRYVYTVADYDGRTGIIQRQSVTIGPLLDQQIEVLDGLQGGEKVVVAGIDEVTPGMKVSLYKGKPYGSPND